MKTEQELRNSTNWDYVELAIDVDVDKLRAWYDEIKQKFPELKFSFAMKEYILPREQHTDNSDVLYGGVHSFGMSWPVEQNLPIPPRYAARPDLYPETTMSEEEFGAGMKVMERYKFGYFKELLDRLGEDTFSWSRITVHDPAASIQPHTDGLHSIRLHIPIVTNDNAWFGWGDKKYNFIPGKVYLINTGIEHYTTNDGNTERAHIISHPTNVSWLLEHLS